MQGDKINILQCEICKKKRKIQDFKNKKRMPKTGT